MIRLIDISLLRGGRPLLSDANLTIHPGRRVGLIGANGTGKTSLFKLLQGELELDGGDLQINPQWRIAHMAQEVSASDRRAIDYVLDGDTELRQLQCDIELAQAAEDHLKHASLLEQLDAIDGFNAEVRGRRLLHGLGFADGEVERLVTDFSGGWRIRLNLARALMCPSDLLLLDEPTNHLDLDACFWLEAWLKRYQGTLLLISHDRDFLDSVVDEIASLEQQQLQLYKGHYSAYERQRAERMALQQAAFEKQQRRVGEIQDFVRRFRAKATKAKQAQSRLKELERMELIAPAHADSPFKFHFLNSDKSSDPLLGLTDAKLGYGERVVVETESVRIHPGSRIGLLGANGAGKSTLLKSLVNDLALVDGERICGEHLQIGYFAQHQLEALDMSASPLLHLQRLTPTTSEQEIRNFLGGFNFHGEDATGSIVNFSGGEKARLALAIVAWGKPNLLILDEPTNHLDLEMCHALTVAIQQFEGAVVVVSHDRHLLKNSVEQFWLLSAGTVEEFDGSLDDYHHLLQQLKQQQAIQNSAQAATADSKVLDKKAQRQYEAELRKQLAPLKKRCQKLEQELEKVSLQLATVEQALADVAIYEDDNKARLQTQLLKQAELTQSTEDIESQWMIAQEELEQKELLLRQQ
ncbi:putative ABC transporter ATP-binding protein YheS [Sinobacterium norvegicum]|uniref:ABC transporter ATP-binding protein YheS n=1 Tax=Sinobacterium norvegicum TaxID=1641715 RepID=A0ABN8EHJ9_9GAMM|nr:ATP-binding cassette domain-containing protein [Sinobacterium norvegicum]CAH0991865.1 putative ABC transporter ATP-binding protein YheS [Sinobacterium norvegicum]